MGIVPKAFRNFLALLGWSPGAAGKDADGRDREIFGSDELIQLFSLEGISKSNAVFDNDKLAWFNTEWIRRYSAEQLLPLIEAEWVKCKFWTERTPAETLAAIELLKPRARNLTDFATSFRAYFSDEFTPDTAAVAKFLKDDSIRVLLAELGRLYAEEAEFSEASAEQVLRSFAEKKGVKAGALINGARVVLTGQSVAPSLFSVMLVLGRDRVARRLAAAHETAAA
jgi:glutamyl/glutaminyl-tRNA synthetase